MYGYQRRKRGVNTSALSLRSGSDGGSAVVCICGEQLIAPFGMNRSFKDVLRYCGRYNGMNDRKYKAEELGLTDYDLVRMYDMLVEKICSGPYGRMPPLRTMMRKLEEHRDDFLDLDAGGKADVVSQILNALHCDLEKTDLIPIGGPKVTGRLKLTARISDYDDVKLINQSPSGLFENAIDLKTV